MLDNSNISITLVSENTYTEKQPIGTFIKNRIKADHKVLHHFTTEFLEIPLNIMRENLDTFSINAWIKELPEFDLLILAEAQELIARTATQIFLGEILVALVNAGKKVIVTSAENPTELNTFKEYLYSHLPKESILEADSLNDLF